MANQTTVTFEDAVNFLNTFENKTNVCPFCKTSKWVLSAEIVREAVNEGEAKSISLFIPFGTGGELPSILMEGGISIIAMECKACGYMHLFSKRGVYERLERIRQTEREAQEGNS